MKRIIAVLLTVLLFLCGCNSEPGQSDKKSGGWLLTESEIEEAKNFAGNEPESRPDEYICYISINCKTAIDSGIKNKQSYSFIPDDGVILPETKMEFTDGETVFDILARVVKENGIHMEYTGSKGLQYIEGICNLYEFDCGSLSGWIYSVNGWSPNYGCGQYKIERGDIIKFEYTCNLGEDLGFSVNS